MAFCSGRHLRLVPISTMKTLEERLFECSTERGLSVRSVCAEVQAWLQERADIHRLRPTSQVTPYLDALIRDEVFDTRDPSVVGKMPHRD